MEQNKAYNDLMNSSINDTSNSFQFTQNIDQNLNSDEGFSISQIPSKTFGTSSNFQQVLTNAPDVQGTKPTQYVAATNKVYGNFENQGYAYEGTMQCELHLICPQDVETECDKTGQSPTDDQKKFFSELSEHLDEKDDQL